MLEIEQSLASNVCRCTGYRPILEAFKKLAKDAPKSDRIVDIEDLHICEKTGQHCNKQNCEDDDWCIVTNKDLNGPGITEIKLKDGKCWYKVYEVHDIFKILSAKATESYMLVHGNTAKGKRIYKLYYNVHI